MSYTVLKDIAFEKKHKILKFKKGEKLSSGDFPSSKIEEGFLKDKYIEKSNSVKDDLIIEATKLDPKLNEENNLSSMSNDDLKKLIKDKKAEIAKAKKATK